MQDFRFNARTVTFASALVLAAAAQAQAKPVLVTFHTVAAPAGRVIEALGNNAHKLLGATLDTANDILIIDVKDVPLEDLMQRIATADHATWVKSNGGEYLSRSRADLDKMLDEELQLRTSRAEKSLKHVAEKVKAAGTWDDAAAVALAKSQAQRMSAAGMPGAADGFPRMPGSKEPPGLSPIQRLECQALLALGPEALAQCAMDGRTVFSTSPTPFQKRLDSRFQDLITRYSADREIWSRAVASLPKPPNPDGDDDPDDMPDGMNAQKLAAPLAKLEIVVGGRFDGEIQVRVIDDKGGYVETGSQYLAGQEEEMMGVYQSMGPDLSAVGKTSMPLCPVSQWFRDAVAGMGKRGPAYKPPVVPPEIRQQLLNPVACDPLSFMSSDFAFAVAKAADSNLVGALPDSMMTGSMLAAFADPSKLEAAQKFGRLILNTNVDLSDGWLVISPVEPWTALQKRDDRDAMAVVIRFAISGDRPTLDERALQAIFNAGHTDPLNFMLSWPTMLGVFLNPTQALASMASGENQSLLALYGMMDSSQKAALQAGKGLRLSELSASQTDFLAKAVYGAELSFSIEDMTPADLGDKAAPTVPESYDDFSFQQSETEPTDSLPDGLPMNAVIELKVDDVSVIKPEGDSDNPLNNLPMTADDLAGMMAMADYQKAHPAKQEEEGRYGDYKVPTQFHVGHRKAYKFKLKLTKHAGLSCVINEDSGFDGAAVAFDELPDEFRKAVEKARKEQVEPAMDEPAMTAPAVTPQAP